jgi:HK97 family phage prohead protease
MNETRSHIDPPEYIKENARKGLNFYKEGLAGDGLTDQTVKEAQDMARGDITHDKLIRASAWGKRHNVDLESAKNSNADNEDYPGPGAVAHFLWGFDPLNPGQAQEWFDRAVQKLEEEDTRSKPVYKSRPKVLIPRDGKENRSLTHAMEVRDVDDNTGTISGYGAVFNSPSLLLSGGFIETVSPGAFKKSLNERGTQTSKEDIFAYWNHNSDIVLGSKRAGTLRLKEDETGLSYEIDMDLRSQEVRDKYYTVQRGNVSSSSFGFDVPKDGDQWILPQNDEEPVQRVLRSVRLHEVSIVSTPAYPESGSWVSRSLESLAQASGINIDEIEDAIDKKDLRSLILERVESSDDHSIEVNADIRSRKLYLMSKKNDIRLDS